ncbi:hypothetical protein B8A32_09105 [Loigolactobacillus backii]|nr:hypothetical protein AYR55_01955 [Loigolactobacillus backii]OLF70788.1 hypothetical protein ACX53_00230 [Loigolactobacillus backii]PIO87275.1 hypothetical protein B8A32_09105 [Loigolactobacillus backii]
MNKAGDLESRHDRHSIYISMYNGLHWYLVSFVNTAVPVSIVKNFSGNFINENKKVTNGGSR